MTKIKKPNKRIWKDEEIIGMGSTLANLRRMRTAAVMIEPTTGIRFKKLMRVIKVRESVSPRHK